jgi:hypothetical protein
MAKARQDFYKAQGMDVPDNVVLAQVWKEYKAQVDAQNASKPDDGLASQGLLPYLAAGGLGLGGAGLLYGLSRRDDKETKKKRRALGLGRD